MATSLRRIIADGLKRLVQTQPRPQRQRRTGSPSPARTEPASPGQFGSSATVEVRGRDIGSPHIEWCPELDGDPDPGEVIWTWVPYEEADGRGKDRPVLVFARESGGTVLAIQLSSRDHAHDRGWVRLGRGGWDRQGRESWANVRRILRVHPDGMRREGDLTDRDDFQRVVAALTRAGPDGPRRHG